MRDHTDIEELLALEALGGLEPDDRARLDVLLTEHGADCAGCEDLRAALADTAAMLGVGLEPSAVSADLEDRTVAAALVRPGGSDPTSGDGRSRADGGPAAIAPSHRALTALIAIAAAVALVALGALGGYLAAPRDRVETFLGQAGVQIVPFAPSNGTSGAMTLAVAPDGTNAYVLGSGLAEPPAGKTYELWTIKGKTPTSLGCVMPTNGQVVEPVSGTFSTADVAAVTVESNTCPSAPTTTPVMVATL
jgi:anti-sigma-K factor RskA